MLTAGVSTYFQVDVWSFTKEEENEEENEEEKEIVYLTNTHFCLYIKYNCLDSFSYIVYFNFCLLTLLNWTTLLITFLILSLTLH